MLCLRMRANNDKASTKKCIKRLKKLDNVHKGQCLKIVSTPSNMKNVSVTYDNTIQIRIKLINQQFFSFMTIWTAFQCIKQSAVNKHVLLVSISTKT